MQDKKLQKRLFAIYFKNREDARKARCILSNQIPNIQIQRSYIVVDERQLKALKKQGIKYRFGINPDYIPLYPVYIDPKLQRKVDEILAEFPPLPIKHMLCFYLLSKMHLKALDVSGIKYEMLEL